MDRTADMETEALKRIVALLFALADLAERTSGRSYPVRCFVLWVLRRAEGVARSWVAADRADMESTAPVAVLHRNSSSDAIDLAQTFRTLALELRRQLRLEERLACRLPRGEANGAATNATWRSLFTAESVRRFGWTLCVALGTNDVAFAAAPHLDSS
ncbi:MAG: hypothetical protein AB7P20_19950 [Rhizobiaceae bacterium]